MDDNIQHIAYTQLSPSFTAWFDAGDSLDTMLVSGIAQSIPKIIENNLSKEVLDIINNYEHVRRTLHKIAQKDLHSVDYEADKADGVLLALRGEQKSLSYMIENNTVLPVIGDITKKTESIAEIVNQRYSYVSCSSDVNSVLTAITRPIKAKYAGITYEFGEFWVVMHWRKAPKIWATEGNKRAVDKDYPHPHISKGECCFGDWATPIMNAIGKRLYLDALVVIYEYLSSINPYSAYINPNTWLSKEVADTLCADCLHVLDSCECEKCEGCDNHPDDCDCLRCPSSGDRIDEIGDDVCSGCNSYNPEDVDDEESRMICTY